ncbi:D-alanine--D-alanine ligase [Fusobacterium sp. MFO224]|uniref:D-alanine--D-alanine ligase family protein n=1 Tax=Fusobacterium sp. MFO224 TaxID=3378070 RepID=UPI003851DF03
MKIGVFMGGISSEREISIKTGTAILKSLLRQGYDAYGIELHKDNMLKAFLDEEYDVAFLALHGIYGEDGRIQALLDILGKKYTGSSMISSAISMDKDLTKKIAISEGIKVPKTYKIHDIYKIEDFPVVVKPVIEGSSVGLYICKSIEEVKKALAELSEKEVTIEQFIKGEELTVGVIQGEPLGVLKIKPKKGLYDYKSKYTKGMTEYEYPAVIDNKDYKKAMEYATIIHNSLKMNGISRSDFILSNGDIYFLEVNSCPGMTETSLVPKLATLKGYTFDDLIKKMLKEINL